MKGLPADNGLYMPQVIPSLPPRFLQRLSEFSFQEIAFEISKALIGSEIPESDLWKIIQGSITFEAPIRKLSDLVFVLELFHGPSLAFKDFGARFMAQLMSHYNQGEAKDLIILVATSGDTGGAVAAGFYDTPGIKIVIFYPSGKVSPLQEKQLTTLGRNVMAVEIEGTFDDCQALVKQAFLDIELNQKLRLSSANSINIARLIPQIFYYFEGYKQMPSDRPVVFSVPSGNFGNLTAGLFAKRMGLPVQHFIAATNKNDVVPKYLNTGAFKPRPSVRTLSNAMDVGNPSNFFRILDLYGSTWNNLRTEITGYAFSDEDTRKAMQAVFNTSGYVLDPHGAVGYLALSEFQKSTPDVNGIVLETAHPAKFLSNVEDIIGEPIEIPARLRGLQSRNKIAVKFGADFANVRAWLLDVFFE